MATVKFHEGTKFETSLDLENDEDVIFVRPLKNRMMRIIPPGCLRGLLNIITLGIINIFKPSKNRYINLVITNKRLVTIPIPPNKKKCMVESYYFKDISGIREIAATKDDEGGSAAFSINMKSGGNSKYDEGGEFRIFMALSAKNIFNAAKLLGKEIGDGLGKGLAEHVADNQTYANKLEAERTGASHYIKVSPQFIEAAKIDFSDSDFNQIRDFIMELVEQGIEAAQS